MKYLRVTYRKQLVKKLKPLASFIVINWKSEDITAGCVRNIRTLKTKEQIEIIIIDNQSTKSSVAELTKLGAKLITSDVNLGFGGAINKAAKEADGQYLAFVNNDAVLDKNWLTEGLRCFGSSDKIVAAGGVEYLWDGKERIKNELYSIPVVSTKTVLVQQSKQSLPTQEVPYTTASNMIIKKTAFNEVGGFDADYFTYYEDMDLCARLINARHKVYYCAEMIAWHRINFSSNRNKYLKYSFIFKNRFRIIAKFYPKELWGKVVTKNILWDIFVSPFFMLMAAILSFAKPRYREKISLYYARFKASLWALRNINMLKSIRKQYHLEAATTGHFYHTIAKMGDYKE